MDNNLIKLVKDLKEYKNGVILSGAGISTNAGIPDFRGGKEDSLYTKYSSNSIGTGAFIRNTEEFYKIFIEKFEEVFSSKPTLSHKVISDLENKGFLTGVITQNVDYLHQKAGSKNVIEYHGNLRSVSKVQFTTKQISDHSKFIYIPNSDIILDEINPVEHLRRLSLETTKISKNITEAFKPNVVLFGENVLGNSKAKKLITHSNILIIVGTSYRVSPFNTLHKDLSRALSDKYRKAYYINNVPLENSNIGQPIIQIIGDTDEIFEKISKLI